VVYQRPKYERPLTAFVVLVLLWVALLLGMAMLTCGCSSTTPEVPCLPGLPEVVTVEVPGDCPEPPMVNPPTLISRDLETDDLDLLVAAMARDIAAISTWAQQMWSIWQVYWPSHP